MQKSPPETMPTKTIAMPQLLEAIKELSVKFRFDEMMAREHLGLPVKVTPQQQKEARALAQRLRTEIAADTKKKALQRRPLQKLEQCVVLAATITLLSQWHLKLKYVSIPNLIRVKNWLVMRL